MSFAARETSRDRGAPIVLLRFKYGPAEGDVYAYTTAEESLDYAGDTYEPVPIHPGTVTASGSLDKASFELRLSMNLEIASLFRGYPPSHVVTLKVFEGHVGESEFKPRWLGRVLGVGEDNNELVLACEPISTSMQRSGLRRHYQRGCPHAHYGPQCGLDIADFTIVKTVAAVTSPQVTLPADWNGDVDAARYVGGRVWWTNAAGRIEYRSLLRNNSDTVITLGGDCSTLEPGDTLSLAPNCRHTTSDCSLFGNINNFGGQPWIPLRNPLGVVNNFS